MTPIWWCDPLSSRAVAFAAALVLCTPLLIVPSGVAAQDRATPGPPPVVGAIQVDGNRRVRDATVLTEIGIQVGDSIRHQDVNRAIKRLWSTQQFSNVEIRAVPDAADPTGPITLRVVVEEQPLVRAIEFRGLENIGDSAIRDTVDLNAGEPYSPAKAEAAEAMTRSLLADKGFFVRDVTHELEEIPGIEGERRLVFDVEEGQKVAISAIEFEGNEAFTDEELTGALSTKKEGFLWFRTGMFDEEELRADLRANLPEYYASEGYIDFTVVGDSIAVDESTGKAKLFVQVSEGPQYALGSFDIRGNRRFPTTDLRSFFERERGGLLRSLGIGVGGRGQVAGESVFDEVAFMAATTEVQRLYSNYGYLYAEVDPVIERQPGEDGDPPTVAVSWNIREGQPAFINEVRISGNTYTHEDVIRGQLSVLPGDIYSEDLIIQSYQRISGLGFFETPLPLPDILPDPETGDVDVTFNVVERQTGSVNFGTSVGGSTGIAGFLGYDQPNLFGQAKSGSVQWEFGSFTRNFTARYSDPSILGSRYSGSLSLFSSSDRFFTFSEGRRQRTGAGLRFGIPLPFDIRNSTFNVGYSLSRTTYDEFEEGEVESLFSLPPGVQSTFTVGLQRNTLDHPFFPTVGTRMELETALNGGILGGDGTFQKATLLGAWYVPVGQLGGGQPGSRPIRMTLGLNVEAGSIFGDASRFPFDQFWMGGVQFGLPLRGYEETTVTPSGVIPRDASDFPLENRIGNAYVRLSAEYAIRLNDNISLSTFYDAGNLWRRPGEINPMRLVRGAGIGVMLVTPFGPLGLDYAYGFDKPNPGWQLHFKFGQGF